MPSYSASRSVSVASAVPSKVSLEIDAVEEAAALPTRSIAWYSAELCSVISRCSLSRRAIDRIVCYMRARIVMCAIVVCVYAGGRKGEGEGGPSAALGAGSVLVWHRAVVAL